MRVERCENVFKCRLYQNHTETLSVKRKKQCPVHYGGGQEDACTDAWGVSSRSVVPKVTVSFGGLQAELSCDRVQSEGMGLLWGC